jgi:hypothetical protein
MIKKNYKFEPLKLIENIFCSFSALVIIYLIIQYIKVVLTNI